MHLTETLHRLTTDFSGTAGVFAWNLTTGETAGVNPELPFPPASTIKVPVLVEVFRQAEAGLCRLDEPLTMNAGDQVPGAGVLRDLTPGLQISLRDAATLMITVSDNTASNLCIERVGLAAVNATCAALGLSQTHLNRPLFRETDRPLGQTSARDLGVLLAAIWQGAQGSGGAGAAGAEVAPGPGPEAGDRAEQAAGAEAIAIPAIPVSPRGCRAMLEILGRQQVFFLTRDIPDCFPPGDEPSPVRVAGKTGWVTGVRNDVALFTTPRATYVLAVLTRDAADPRPRHPDHEGERLLGRIGAAVFDAWGR